MSPIKRHFLLYNYYGENMKHYNLHQFNTWTKEHIVDKNKFNEINIYLSMKFICPFFKFTKLVLKSKFIIIIEKTFKNNKLFFCNNCNKRINPISIETDF